ncbi:uncharacterized protein LOC127810417 [Diospyros lotus]|uniref:uncharacterized protein LOC127810417 n=1 Tax=Diospyros lotus TaxID=55363 RepID=UPI0022519BFD|nr:uncharacterized protein LOC127810417 [Diospyros lotus]
MDEFEFERILNLFPIVRPRHYQYQANSASSRRLTAQSAQNKIKERQDVWDMTDRKEIAIQGIKQDAFWERLKMAAEKKVGAAEAERLCKAFQRIHLKLVYEELSPDAARSFLSSYKSSGE